MKLYHYEEAPFTSQGETVGNKVQHTDCMSLVTWRFTKGHIGAMHVHPQEQLAYVLEGRVEFKTEAGSLIAKAGDQVLFAGNEAHGSVALEDSIVLDIFSSVREDFKDKFDVLAPAQSV